MNVLEAKIKALINLHEDICDRQKTIKNELDTMGEGESMAQDIVRKSLVLFNNTLCDIADELKKILEYK
jgi:hypothetical protein